MPRLDCRPAGTPPRGTSRAWRRPATLAVAALSLLAVVGLSRLRLDDDLRSLLRDSAADFRLVDEVAERFGSSDRDLIVLATARTGDLFTPPALHALRSLAAALAELDGVEGVRSMLDIRREGVAGAVLPVIPRVDGELAEPQIAAARTRATNHALIAGHLLSTDATTALIVARLAATADRPPRVGTVVGGVERLLAARRAAGGPLDLELTGLPALREQAARAVRHDMLVFNSLGLGLAVLLSAAVARSFRATLVACVPPFVGAVWAMGTLGLCGVPVNLLTSVVPSLALVVGTCDSIHFIEDMRRSARRGVDGVTASTGAVRRVGVACGLTSLVTAIGFASLAAARIDAVRDFGLAAAAGAVASFMAVTLVTPLLGAARPFTGRGLGRSSRRAGRLAGALTAFSVRHARPIALAGCLATLVLAAFASGLDADSRMVDSLPRAAPASRALARVDRDFGGVMGVDVLVGWPADVDWRDAPLYAALDEVHAIVEQSAGVARPLSLATVVGGLPKRARDRLDDGDFRDLVDVSSRTAIVRARAPDLGSRALEGVYARIDAQLAALAATRPGWRFELAGMSVVSARNIRQLVRDLGSSLLLEVAVIGGILALAFRSPLTGLVSLVPNLFPLAVIASLLVATGQSLDPATVIVFNVCLGLAVDDTVHVLAALQRRRRDGLSITTAVRRAVAETGNAVVLGGLVLTIGFAAVTVSSVPSLSRFGGLACAAVAAATLAELVFLPALLVVTDAVTRRFPTKGRDGIFGPQPLPWPVAVADRGRTGRLAG